MLDSNQPESLPNPAYERDNGYIEYPSCTSKWSCAIPVNINGRALAKGPLAAPPEVAASESAGDNADWITMCTLPGWTGQTTIGGTQKTLVQPVYDLQACITAGDQLCFRLAEHVEGGEEDGPNNNSGEEGGLPQTSLPRFSSTGRAVAREAISTFRFSSAA